MFVKNSYRKKIKKIKASKKCDFGKINLHAALV